jgi:serine/threonine protein kinase/tetratricopeptide (TPR) repeat protein
VTEREIFLGALEIADPAARKAYLDRACAGDKTLVGHVEDLLEIHAKGGSLFESPPAAASTVASSTGEQPSMVIGPYKLLQKIGEGGMGTVFMAEQTHPIQRRVAIKITKPGTETRQIVARFEAERQALAMMDHPNIARVLDAGTVSESSVGFFGPTSRPYFVMELVRGVPITKYCDERQLAPRNRLELFVPVCHALQHAHQKGIIHRDLKPSNILVAEYDDKPVAKVIDFGVAKAVAQKLTERTMFTQFGQVVGTIEYMSPEQAKLNALDIDTRSDIYGLGVLLYELLTGTTPLDGSRLRGVAYDELFRLIREEEPPTPSTRLSTTAQLPTIAANRGLEPKRLSRLLRGELDWIVMKCLEKDRDRRYDSAAALARDLERYLNDEPVEACAPSAAYRFRKLVHRHKGPVVALTSVVLLLVAGIVGTSTGLVRAGEAMKAESSLRQIAEANEKTALEEKAAAVEARELEQLARQRETEQRERAEVSEKTAIAKRKIAVAVQDFLLQDLLHQADAIEQAFSIRRLGGGFEVKDNPSIKELLDRTAAALTPAQILEKFPDEPEVHAAILKTVGTTYLAIGDHKNAIEFLTRSSDSYRRIHGGEHPDTLAALNQLGLAYSAAGKTPQAIALFENIRDIATGRPDANEPSILHNLAAAYLDAGKPAAAIELFESVRDTRIDELGREAASVLTTENCLALAYYQAGKLSQAVELWEHVLAQRSDALGGDHPATLTAKNNLALAYRTAGRLPQAIELLEQVLDSQVKMRGPEHPYVIITMSNLGTAYVLSNDITKGAALLEQARDGAIKNLGPEHPRTLNALNNLAWAYHESGRLPQAIELYEQARAGLLKRFGANHPETLTTTNNLAAAHQSTRNFDQALPLYLQTATAIERVGFAHPDARSIIYNLSFCHEEMNQYAEAEAWKKKWVAFVRNKGEIETVDFASDLASLGLNLVKQKKWKDAEPVLRECLTRREKLNARANQPVAAWQIATTKSMLGGALAGQEQYGDAEPLLLAGYEGLKSGIATLPPPGQTRLLEAIERLVDFYTATNKLDEATKWRERLQEDKSLLEEAAKNPR